MSTLCTYENYLRDRYVLGQSVHYAAGSNPPKPKSYDREGNEYVWSDEAGDYVRQVGGPGGGRTIRLSEVEQSANEEPQSAHKDAASGQGDSKKEKTPQSNVDYSGFADAYKRYRAEDKKIASLKRKAAKIQKAATDPSSKATPEEIKSAKESLAKIRDDISASEEVKTSLSSGLNSFAKKYNVVFVDGGDSFVVNPSSELLQGLRQRKSLQDRIKEARKKAEGAKKAGFNSNASEIASIADKLEGELNRVNDTLSQMFPNETVVSTVDEKPKRQATRKKQKPKKDSTLLKPSGEEVSWNVATSYPGTYSSYRQGSPRRHVSFPEIFQAIATNDLDFFDGAPSVDDDSEKITYRDRLSGETKQVTPLELYEFLQNGLTEHALATEYEFTPGYTSGFDEFFNPDLKALPSEYRYAVDYNSANAKATREASDAVHILELFQTELESLDLPEDIGDALAVYAHKVAETLPDAYDGSKEKCLFSTRVKSLVGACNLAYLASETENKDVSSKALQLAQSFLAASVSDNPRRRLTYAHRQAEKLGFKVPASIDTYLMLSGQAEYVDQSHRAEASEAPKGIATREPEAIATSAKESVDKPEVSDLTFEPVGLGLPGKNDGSLKPGVAENKDAAYFIRRDIEATPKTENKENAEEVAEASKAPSSKSSQRDDDAALELKVNEGLSKGNPLRKKATRLRSKAKNAALKGRKEEAAGLRKQADEIEAEARKYIDEAINAGVELKNRRAEASQETADNPVKKTEPASEPVANQNEVESVWIEKSLGADEDVAPYVNEISKKLKQEAAYYAKRGDVKKTEAVLKALRTFSEKWGLEFNQRFADSRLRIASMGGASEENTVSERDMPIDPASRTTHPQDPRYYPIDEEQIRAANSITSHFAPPVGTETKKYRQLVDKAIEAGELRKKEVDARYHADIDKSVKRYAKKLADWVNEKWRIIGSYGSSYVVGPGNYSMRKHDKKHRRLDAHNKGYAEVEELFENISRIGVPNAQQPVPEMKESIEKMEVPNSSVPGQQSEPVAAPAQEKPAKPRPERWTPIKSKMNDDDRRVVENTRKRINFGLGDFAWRLANAKEKKDWQKAKELTVLAAQRYLEQARRAYRSHGGADALAAFDASLSGEGLTVGQVRDRVVDKFRQLASMSVGDLHKYAGERLDEWEAFSQGAGLSSAKDIIALNRLLDKPHYAPNAVPHATPEKGKIYEVPIDSLNLDPSRFQFKLNTNAQGVTDDLEGAEFDPQQAGIIHVWRDPDDGKDYVVNGHHRFNLAKNSGYNGKVNVRYIDADTADDAKAFGAVANIADSKGTATDVAEFIRARGSDDIRTPAGKKIATKNKLLAEGRVLAKLDEAIFRKLKNGLIDEKTARVIATELPDDKDKQLRLFADIERLGLDASQAQDRAWAYASIQGEKQQGSLFGDDAPMEYDVESRSKLIGEIKKNLSGAKRAAQAGGSNRNNEYWESQKLAANFDKDRAKQLSKTAGQTLDFFKDHIRLTGPMQTIVKEETDEYRKAIKSGQGAEKVVERAIERIKDVAQGGDGSVRRVEGLGLEYEDRLPSVESQQSGQVVEAKREGEKSKPSRTPSESIRDGATGEVLEAGRTDRLSDGGDGRDNASVIASKPTGTPNLHARLGNVIRRFTDDPELKKIVANTIVKKRAQTNDSVPKDEWRINDPGSGFSEKLPEEIEDNYFAFKEAERIKKETPHPSSRSSKKTRDAFNKTRIDYDNARSKLLLSIKEHVDDLISQHQDKGRFSKVIAEEAKKSDIPESRVREELAKSKQPKTSPDSQKAAQSLRNLIQRVYDHDGLSESIKTRAANAFGNTLSAPGETGFESTGEHDKHLFELADKLDEAKKKLEKAQERFDEKPDSEKLERAVDKAEDAANEIEDRLVKAVDDFIQLHGGKSKSNRPATVAKKETSGSARDPQKETSGSTRDPQKEDKPDWLKELDAQKNLRPVSRGKYNPYAKPYSWQEDAPNKTEDELRRLWRDAVDGGEDEDFNVDPQSPNFKINGRLGNEPLSLDELERFEQIRRERERRKAHGLSENFGARDLAGMRELLALIKGEDNPAPKRGPGRPGKQASKPSEEIAQEVQKSEIPKKQVSSKIAEALGVSSDASK